MIRSYDKQYTQINETKNKVVWFIVTLILICLACARYFYCIDAREAFEVDEAQTFSAAVGYLNTGQLCLWDFWNCASSNEPYGYNIAPYLILLANWMKIFGVSLTSARCLSAVIGCIFILSCIFIIKKLFNRLDITIISVVFMIIHPEITYIFRFIRMYSLVMLLSIWFIYFMLMALTKPNHFKADNRIVHFITKNCNFNFLYAIGAIVVLYISSKTHNIQMVTCGGVLLFIFYKTISSNDRKYKNIACIGIVCITLGIIGILFGDILYKLPVINYFFGELKYWVRIDGTKAVGYFWDNVNAIANQPLIFLGWGLAVLSIWNKKEDKNKDSLLFLIFIQVIAIVFFVWFANRYYQFRYLCFIIPISIIIFSFGFVYILGKGLKQDILLAFILCINILQYYNSSFNYLYTLWDAPALQGAYAKIAEYSAEEDEIDILAYEHDMRYYGYFASKQLSNVSYQEWGNYDTPYSFCDVSDYAIDHSRALILVWQNFLFYRRESQRRFLQEWTDRIAGEGLDHYNVEVGRLNYIQPVEEEKISVNSERENPISIWKSEETNKYKLKLDGSILSDETQFVCIKLCLENESGESEEVYYQLGVPSSENHKYYYIYEVYLNADEAALDLRYALAENERLVEYTFEPVLPK